MKGNRTARWLAIVIPCIALVSTACGGPAGDLRSALRAYDDGTDEDARIRARVLRAVEAGADPNLVYSWLTPLSLAIQMEDKALVTALIEAGANVDAQADEDGDLLDPPLFDAVGIGDSAIVELLLEAGASITPIPDESSALDIAIRKGHQDIVDLLLQRELPASVLSQAVHTALQAANAHTLQQLLEAGAAYDTSTPLLVSAVYGGNPNLVKRMLAFSYDPEQVNRAYEVAADLFAWGAEERPHTLEVMRLLLQSPYQASPQTLGAALYSVVAARSVEGTKLLLEHDGNLSEQDLGRTLIAIANRGVFDPLENMGSDRTVAEEVSNQKELTTLLLEHGANINSVDEHNRSALIHAAMELNADLVEMLVDRGADTSLIDATGNTARQYALDRRPKMPSKQDKAGQAAVTMFGLTSLIEQRQKNADKILALLE